SRSTPAAGARANDAILVSIHPVIRRIVRSPGVSNSGLQDTFGHATRGGGGRWRRSGRFLTLGLVALRQDHILIIVSNFLNTGGRRSSPGSSLSSSSPSGFRRYLTATCPTRRLLWGGRGL